MLIQTNDEYYQNVELLHLELEKAWQALSQLLSKTNHLKMANLLRENQEADFHEEAGELLVRVRPFLATLNSYPFLEVMAFLFKWDLGLRNAD